MKNMKCKLFVLIAVIAVACTLLCVFICRGGDHEKSTDDKTTEVGDPDDERVEVATVYAVEKSSEPSAKFSRDVDKVMKSVSGLKTTGKTVLGARRGKSAAFSEGSGGIGDGLAGLLGGSAEASMVRKKSAPRKSKLAAAVRAEVSDSDESRDETFVRKRIVGGSHNNRKSGLLTAGEWNDLDNWKFWSGILNDNDFYGKTEYWKFFPKNLVAVRLVDANGTGFANVTVELLKRDSLEFATKTDNEGYAYCWINLFSDEKKELEAKDFSLKVNGEHFKGPFKLTAKGDEKLNVNVIFKKGIKHAKAKADVAFIVDATGSMRDEIQFLKSDLTQIINHASAESKVALRTAALFYRDVGDEFLTRHDDFSNDVSKTQKYISEQDADGGGDYPEAVHTALEASLQNLSWDASARSRIAFLILDAPAHYEPQIIESLQKSIALYAKNGIKLIPVAASGVDKDTEFMLRFFDVSTGGTYVFLTDDSGIGNSHIKASVGDHKIESLADLMVRLIKKYVK